MLLHISLMVVMLGYFGEAQTNCTDRTPPIRTYQDFDACDNSRLRIKPKLYVVPRKHVKCGGPARINETRQAPSIVMPQAKDNMRYHVLMVDPDAPSKEMQTYKYYFHWGLMNIMGSHAKMGNMTGDTFIAYLGPGPPVNTSLHRYQFLIFETPMSVNPGSSPTERANLNLEHFLSRLDLCTSLVGTTEYLASYMDYLYPNGVSKLSAQGALLVGLLLLAFRALV